jgi:hypothetical protein
VAYLPICGFQEFHPVGRVSSCGWVALCERRRVGFARLSGWQPVGNWSASAGEFSSIPVTRQQPRSLGLIQPGQPIRLTIPPDLAGRLTPDAALAVSLEPPGGSPTGQPTGPVIASGKLTSL